MKHWLQGRRRSGEKGEPVVEVETDKITIEIEAPDSGVLKEVLAQEGDYGVP
jgi:pyruvate/2-oxoglutarate dehydrogenase complex dihydrolipoamide acyltransferase (E2) component